MEDPGHTPIEMRDPDLQARLPLHLAGRIPQSEGLARCRGGSTQGFRGVTHRVTNPMHPEGTTTRKRGDAEGTPPQTLVFVFLVQVILCCSYLCYAYDFYDYSMD